MSIPESIRAAMQQTNERFSTEVVAGGNFDALDHIYTSGARILPPGASLMQGRDQIKGFWQQAVQGLGIKSAQLSTIDAEQAGDTVVEIGKAELRLADGNTVEVKYVVHWKQEDGAWKWNVDIWNMNQ